MLKYKKAKISPRVPATAVLCDEDKKKIAPNEEARVEAADRQATRELGHSVPIATGVYILTAAMANSRDCFQEGPRHECFAKVTPFSPSAL